jgi:arabinose-5-phosphate isomerase
MKIIDSIKESLQIEANAILDQIDQIGKAFEDAVHLIATGTGKLIVTGMGKSGHVGRKITATLASTGTPSFFLHPGEAYHGDLGMISSNDIVLMLSNSGETDELLKIITFLKDNGNKTLAITAKPHSTLARNVDIHLPILIKKEACPLSLAPTSSTTVTLAIGDALAIALMRIKEFKPDNFARLHPGGALGRKLLAKVEHKMHASNLPIVSKESSLIEIISTISGGRLGLSLVNDGKKTVGIITDGDLRRLMEKKGSKAWDSKAGDFMTSPPKYVSEGTSLHETEELFQALKITSLVVENSTGNTVGVVQIYDLI